MFVLLSSVMINVLVCVQCKKYIICAVLLPECFKPKLAELQRRIQAMEMRCYRKILHISYKDHVTNEEVRAKIQQTIGPHEDHMCEVVQYLLLSKMWSCTFLYMMSTTSLCVMWSSTSLCVMWSNTSLCVKWSSTSF